MNLHRPEAEPPEIVYQLLREVWRRGGPGSGVTLRRTMSSWVAEFGNQAIITPGQFPHSDKTWRLLEFHPPRKPTSETVIEVGS